MGLQFELVTHILKENVVFTLFGHYCSRWPAG